MKLQIFKTNQEEPLEEFVPIMNVAGVIDAYLNSPDVHHIRIYKEILSTKKVKNNEKVS